MTIQKVLIIAGLDPSGNAGLLRDLRIVQSQKLAASAIVTALTSQNKTRFFSTNVVSENIFKTQLKAICPLSQFGSIKIGMLGNEKIVTHLVSFFKKNKNHPPLILDPVFCSSTGGVLLTKKGILALQKNMIPLCSFWTPNWQEASFFSGIKIKSQSDVLIAGLKLWVNYKVPVCIKGFKENKKVFDLLITDKKIKWFIYPQLNRKGLRGTGCSLASLIAAEIAKGKTVETAVKNGRRLMQGWIKTLSFP
ncbi:MAG: hypothetical protein A3G32_06250 [Deltaproteobacteria bacterium RIFCSPLOWO2_12_FULL_40_28]|nr:MAG: hypothetical protein A3C45_02345 [Deltaproteobacteria bacterium RIFCSPHIGHO2_02_FULL_40_28]OGQ19056.1 MAG: hypothetical protein A3E27_05435 [Deltaproteobacteria bacterium RIFCSPHIGHO2_12_FULL_40_32]OGQ40228.1 MAG: hypothetical protein A3I69_00875 [Deltaproteobacteria bacterium RIFCSPLOWO2_02_FULL_40_36]OGQ53499.1 MAG: hypothetical protein A3G32_06250 [Deltaproteobacteria bacterium RIFCSPLOWO2_12_FULL_40_28]